MAYTVWNLPAPVVFVFNVQSFPKKQADMRAGKSTAAEGRNEIGGKYARGVD